MRTMQSELQMTADDFWKCVPDVWDAIVPG